MDITVTFSGIVGKQGLTQDGKLHTLVANKSKGSSDEYFLSPSATLLTLLQNEKKLEGKRIVVQGSLSSEKTELGTWQQVVRPYKILSLSSETFGNDYVGVSFAGKAKFRNIRQAGDKPVLGLNVAVERENKEGKKSSSYINASLWGELATKNSYLESQEDVEVVVFGGLTPRTYQKNDGTVVNDYEVWVNDFMAFSSTKPNEVNTPESAENSEDVPF